MYDYDMHISNTYNKFKICTQEIRRLYKEPKKGLVIHGSRNMIDHYDLQIICHARVIDNHQKDLVPNIYFKYSTF